MKKVKLLGVICATLLLSNCATTSNSQVITDAECVLTTLATLAPAIASAISACKDKGGQLNDCISAAAQTAQEVGTAIAACTHPSMPTARVPYFKPVSIK